MNYYFIGIYKYLTFISGKFSQLTKNVAYFWLKYFSDLNLHFTKLRFIMFNILKKRCNIF